MTIAGLPTEIWRLISREATSVRSGLSFAPEADDKASILGLALSCKSLYTVVTSVFHENLVLNGYDDFVFLWSVPCHSVRYSPLYLKHHNSSLDANSNIILSDVYALTPSSPLDPYQPRRSTLPSPLSPTSPPSPSARQIPHRHAHTYPLSPLLRLSGALTCAAHLTERRNSGT